ncbi:MAG: hypothetical protein AAFQ02_09160 [Bacteroidota bacterium]
MKTDITELKKLYWAGESTLEEERELKTLLLDKHDEVLSPLFAHYAEERALQMNGEIKPIKSPSRVLPIRRWMAIAASVVVLASAYMTYQAHPVSEEIVVQDPEVALEITMEAFGLIRGKMDHTESALRQGITQLDKTYINKIL